MPSYLSRYQNGEFKIDRRELRLKLKAELKAQLGPSRASGTSEYRFRTWMNGVTVRTHLDTGGSTRQFSCSHAISSGQQEYWGNDQTTIHDGMSMVEALGVFPSTEWRYISQEEVPIAVESAKMLCAHFLKAVPMLVEGLSDES